MEIMGTHGNMVVGETCERVTGGKCEKGKIPTEKENGGET
jgi:hypothetical protein